METERKRSHELNSHKTLSQTFRQIWWNRNMLMVVLLTIKPETHSVCIQVKGTDVDLRTVPFSKSEGPGVKEVHVLH